MPMGKPDPRSLGEVVYEIAKRYSVVAVAYRKLWCYAHDTLNCDVLLVCGIA